MGVVGVEEGLFERLEGSFLELDRRVGFVVFWGEIEGCEERGGGILTKEMSFKPLN